MVTELLWILSSVNAPSQTFRSECSFLTIFNEPFPQVSERNKVSKSLFPGCAVSATKGCEHLA